MKRLAVTFTTCGSAWASARCAKSESAGSAPRPRAPATQRGRLIVPMSGLRDAEFLDLVERRVGLGLDLAEPQPAVRLRRIPRQRRARGLAAGCGQREDQGLGRVVR